MQDIAIVQLIVMILKPDSLYLIEKSNFTLTNRYFYVKLLLSRTLDFFYAFCGTAITVGAQYATLTLSSCPGASIE
jgi:hypothetical protein